MKNRTFWNGLSGSVAKTGEIVKNFTNNFHENFNSYIVIFDCIALFIENHNTTLTPRAAILTNYKHHNTLKVLTGITPQGTIFRLSCVVLLEVD